MRPIYAIKHLFQNYRFIMPTYIASLLVIFIVSHIAPIIGTVLIMPISVGVSYVMTQAIVKDKNVEKIPLVLGFRNTWYIRNLFYLFVRQLLFLSPLIIGTLISGYVMVFFRELTIDVSVVVINLIIFGIPTGIISLMLAMVPYLLADHRFNQHNHNPLKVSAKIMKGNYIRLIIIRVLFAPFIALQSSGIVLLLLSYYNRIFDGEIALGFLRPTLFVIPFVYLLFMPWYRMIHAELYASLRHKVKNYR